MADIELNPCPICGEPVELSSTAMACGWVRAISCKKYGYTLEKIISDRTRVLAFWNAIKSPEDLMMHLGVPKTEPGIEQLVRWLEAKAKLEIYSAQVAMLYLVAARSLRAMDEPVDVEELTKKMDRAFHDFTETHDRRSENFIHDGQFVVAKAAIEALGRKVKV